MQVRTAEPEQLTEPPVECLEHGESAEFGVITPREDAQQSLGYWVQHGDTRDDGERLPPDRVTHLKRNARRSMKRGITDFCFDALDAMYLAGRLRTNLAEGAAQQAGIVGVRQHESGSRDDIQKAWADDPADYEQRSIGGKTTPVRRYRGGEWEDVPKGTMYIPGPGAQNAPAHVQVLQACLRSVGVKWNAPEWLVSGDASNNNFASSLVAESPFVKTVLRQQRRYREAFRAPAWYALEHWCRVCGLTVGGRTLGWEDVRRLVELVVEAPSPEARDRTAEAQRAAIEIPLGVESRQGYCQRQGRDYEQVQADNAAYDEEHGGDDGPPLGGPGGGFGGPGSGGPGGGPLGEGEADPADAVGRALLEAGFTGQITDSAGRQRFYVDGKQVARANYQQQGNTPRNDPTRNVERAQAARQLLANAGNLTPGQLGELAGHLRASSNADLQAMKRDLQARGGGRRKEEMVAKLLAHVGMATPSGGAGGGSGRTGGGGDRGGTNRGGYGLPARPQLTEGVSQGDGLRLKAALGQVSPSDWPSLRSSILAIEGGTPADFAALVQATRQGKGRYTVADRGVRTANDLVAHMDRQMLFTRLMQDRPAAGESPQAFAERHIPELAGISNLYFEGVSSDQARENIFHIYEMLPAVRAILSKNAAIYVSDKAVPETDHMQYLSGVSPRGWAPGYTWDSVAGCYSHNESHVIAGNGIHGSVSLFCHEAGHAIGHKYDLNNSPELIDWHQRLHHKLDPYQQQGGPGADAGRSELLAESIAVFYASGKMECGMIYSDEYANWLERKLQEIVP